MNALIAETLFLDKRLPKVDLLANIELLSDALPDLFNRAREVSDCANAG